LISIDKNGIKTITGAMQRLVSNEKLGLIALIEGNSKSKTWTRQDVEEFSTNELAIARIKEKKWKLPQELTSKIAM
jgi:hypothetical protein